MSRLIHYRSFLAAVFLTTAICSTAVGVIRRHDIPDSVYLAEGEKYPSVCRVLPDGDGTLVGDRWVLTAAHVARGCIRRAAKVQFDTVTYDIEAAYLHPDWTEMSPQDIALLRLSRPVEGIEPVHLYRGGDEPGHEIVFVGHGDTGDGVTGPTTMDRKRRAATNRVEAVEDGQLVIVFDSAGESTSLEGTPGPGDSGGPVFIRIGDSLPVAGISFAGESGRRGRGTYGARDYSVRVSLYVPWLEAVMNGDENVESTRLLPSADNKSGPK